MLISPGIYSTNDPQIKSLANFSIHDGCTHVFVDQILDERPRLLPCISVLQLPSQRQKLEFFHSESLGWSLVLDGELQLTTLDEQQYHRALVCPTIKAAFSTGQCSSVAIIGGGDGYALREVLKHSDCLRCILVDYDPEVVSAFRVSPLADIFQTKDALSDERVELVYEDYRDFLKNRSLAGFDIAIIDLTDSWCNSAQGITDLFRLLMATGESVRYVGAQLGRYRQDIVPELRAALQSLKVSLLALWEIPLISFGEPWCFGLFGLSDASTVPCEWLSSFRYGQLKFLHETLVEGASNCQSRHPAPYSFEVQFELAEVWEKANNKPLLRISDWNSDPNEVRVPYAIIRRAINEALGSTTRYAETAVLIETCDEIQQDLVKGYGISFDKNARIHLFGNATQAIFGVMYGLKQAMSEPRALIIHPSYYSVQDSASQCGIPIFEMWRKKREAFEINLEQLEQFRRQHAINIVILTDPVYSAGTYMNDVQWNDLINYCRTHDIWLVVDMAFSGLSWTDASKVWIDCGRLRRGSYRGVILIDSPAKRLFTNNLKIGLVVADLKIVERLRDFSDWHLGNLTGLQVSFARNLFSPENRNDIETICTINANRACANFQQLETIVDGSKMVSLLRPDSGFYTLLFARGIISRDVDAMKACHRLVTDLATLAIPTNDFFFDWDDEFGIRLNLMCSPRKWEHVIKYIAVHGILL